MRSEEGISVEDEEAYRILYRLLTSCTVLSLLFVVVLKQWLRTNEETRAFEHGVEETKGCDDENHRPPHFTTTLKHRKKFGPPLLGGSENQEEKSRRKRMSETDRLRVSLSRYSVYQARRAQEGTTGTTEHVSSTKLGYCTRG